MKTIATIEDDTLNMPELTGSDEQARRICSLAVAIACSPRPLSTSEIHAEQYPSLSEPAFARAFRRDRASLAACGITIRRTKDESGGARWFADAASFADHSTLSTEDALLLCVLCQQLVDDETFVHRFELRHALAKITRECREAGGTLLRCERSSAGPVLSTMLRCLAEKRLVRILYTDVAGAQSARIVAPYGSFGLGSQLYFVCALATGGLPTAELRTFRADRIAAVEPQATVFELPDDFSIDDHIVLPFQIGPQIGCACFVIPADAEVAMMEQAQSLGALSSDAWPSTKPLSWSVSMSDADAAAAWAIATGITPTEPASLVASWRATLTGAQRIQQAQDPNVVDTRRGRGAAGLSTGGSPANSARNRVGRQSGIEETRELIALVGSLAAQGDTISVDTISARLGVTRQHALTLLNLLLAVGGDDSYLPLCVSDDEEEVTLAFGGGLHGRPVRLTSAETRALVAALDTAGITDADPLRHAVMDAFSAGDIDEEELRRSLVTSAASTEQTALATCARSIVDETALVFDYQGSCDTARRVRHVLAQRLRHDDGHWYLEAFDLDRHADRSFRLSRMHDITAVGREDLGSSLLSEARSAMSHSDPAAPPGAESPLSGRTAVIHFADERVLSRLNWPGLHVITHDRVNGITVAKIPWYEGSWLARHLAACGGTAKPVDRELVDAVREVARDALDRAAHVPCQAVESTGRTAIAHHT